MSATTTHTIHIISCPACGKAIELHATYDVRLGADISATDKAVAATLMMTGARVSHECPPKPSPRNPFTSGGLTIDIDNPVLRED